MGYREIYDAWCTDGYFDVINSAVIHHFIKIINAIFPRIYLQFQKLQMSPVPLIVSVPSASRLPTGTSYSQSYSSVSESLSSGIRSPASIRWLPMNIPAPKIIHGAAKSSILL